MMKQMIFFLLLLILPFSVLSGESDTAGERGDDPEIIGELISSADDIFARALAIENTDPAESRSMFSKAAAMYRSLGEIYGIHNSSVYYNAANAYFRAGSPGAAIYYYNTGMLYDPFDRELANNLRLARESTANTISDDPFIMRLRSVFISYSWRTWCAAAFGAGWLLIWGALIIGRLIKRSGRAFVITGIVVCCISFAAAVPFITSLVRKNGVIMNQTTGYTGSNSAYEKSHSEDFYPGIEFVLLEENGEWIKIRLSDGSSSWIREQTARMIEKKLLR